MNEVNNWKEESDLSMSRGMRNLHKWNKYPEKNSVSYMAISTPPVKIGLNGFYNESWKILLLNPSGTGFNFLILSLRML